MSSYVDKSKKKLAPKAPARRSAPNAAPSQSLLPDAQTSQTTSAQLDQPSLATETPSVPTTSPSPSISSHDRLRDVDRDQEEATRRVRLESVHDHQPGAPATPSVDEQQATQPATKRRRIERNAESSTNGGYDGTSQVSNKESAPVEFNIETSHRQTDATGQYEEQNNCEEAAEAGAGGHDASVQDTISAVPRDGENTSSLPRWQIPPGPEHTQPSIAGRTMETESLHDRHSLKFKNVVVGQSQTGQTHIESSTQRPVVDGTPEGDPQVYPDSTHAAQGSNVTANAEAATTASEQQPQTKKRKQPAKRKRAVAAAAGGQGPEVEAEANAPAPRKRQRKSEAQSAAAADDQATNDVTGGQPSQIEQSAIAAGEEQQEGAQKRQPEKRVKKPKPKPKPRPRNSTGGSQPNEAAQQPKTGADALDASGDTQAITDDPTEEPNSTQISEPQQQPPLRQKRKRASTPSENEDYEIDTSKVTIYELMKDRRRGKKGRIEKEMENVDWDEVKRRRKEAEARARAAGQKASRREAQKELEEEDERRQEHQDAQQQNADEGRTGPGIVMNEEGEIVIDNASLRVNRHQPIDENVEVITEESVTKRVNARSHLFDNRRDPEDRIYTPPGRWSQAETDVFYAALKMFGTDFDMISKMFHGRNRRQIKHKFVREERENGWRINAVLLGQPDPMNFEKYCEFTGQGAEDFKDPAELEAELKEDEERQRLEIEQEREQAAEVQRKKQEAARAKAEAAQRRKSGEKVPRKRRSKKDKAAEAPVADVVDGAEGADGVSGEQAQAGEGGDDVQADLEPAQHDGEQVATGAKDKPKRPRKKAVNPKLRARKAGAAAPNAPDGGGQGEGQGPAATVDQDGIDGEAHDNDTVVQSVEID